MESSTGEIVQVTIHLHTILRKKTADGWEGVILLPIRQGTRINGIKRDLELDYDPENTLVVVNGQLVDLDVEVNDGDVIHFIPAISGG